MHDLTGMNPRMRMMAAVVFLLAVEGALMSILASSGLSRWPSIAEAAAAPRRAAAADFAPPFVRHETSARIRGLVPNARPFRLSDSIVQDCLRTPMFNCHQLDQFLDRMASESRDDDWASVTERRLADLVALGHDDYRIRALECRNTRCAIEVASNGDYPRVSLGADDSLDRELVWDGATTIAWEHDARTGRPTTVTVATWKRRAPSADRLQ
jgi:hypothetical protein